MIMVPLDFIILYYSKEISDSVPVMHTIREKGMAAPTCVFAELSSKRARADDFELEDLFEEPLSLEAALQVPAGNSLSDTTRVRTVQEEEYGAHFPPVEVMVVDGMEEKKPPPPQLLQQWQQTSLLKTFSPALQLVGTTRPGGRPPKPKPPQGTRTGAKPSCSAAAIQVPPPPPTILCAAANRPRSSPPMIYSSAVNQLPPAPPTILTGQAALLEKAQRPLGISNAPAPGYGNADKVAMNARSSGSGGRSLRFDVFRPSFGLLPPTPPFSPPTECVSDLPAPTKKTAIGRSVTSLFDLLSDPVVQFGAVSPVLSSASIVMSKAADQVDLAPTAILYCGCALATAAVFLCWGSRMAIRLYSVSLWAVPAVWCLVNTYALSTEQVADTFAETKRNLLGFLWVSAAGGALLGCQPARYLTTREKMLTVVLYLAVRLVWFASLAARIGSSRDIAEIFLMDHGAFLVTFVSFTWRVHWQKSSCTNSASSSCK